MGLFVFALLFIAFVVFIFVMAIRMSNKLKKKNSQETKEADYRGDTVKRMNRALEKNIELKSTLETLFGDGSYDSCKKVNDFLDEAEKE